jgi:flagellar motor switch protein FliG
MQPDALRKVAILVASLDEVWGERVLRNLPAEVVRQVRDEVEQLAEIDPREQQKIIEEFRRGLEGPRGSASDGVEIEASLLERIDHQSYSHEDPQRKGPLDFISTADADCLVDMLSGESMQTVALVISRLETNHAAEVLNKFSQEQQAEILNRLEQLDTADEHTVAIIEAQINQAIASQRQRRERMAAGKQMVERLMNHTVSEAATQVIAEKMPTPVIANKSEIPPAHPSCYSLPKPMRYEPLPMKRQELPPRNPFAHLSAAESLEHLEKLPDAVLFGALSRTESQVISLALLGASEKLMKRVLRGLSRREGMRFRQQLRDLGPTRLGDILAAQHQLLHTATQLN